MVPTREADFSRAKAARDEAQKNRLDDIRKEPRRPIGRRSGHRREQQDRQRRNRRGNAATDARLSLRLASATGSHARRYRPASSGGGRHLYRNGIDRLDATGGAAYSYRIEEL